MHVLSALKALVVFPGRRPRRVRFGIYRGLQLEIDLATQAQLYLGLQERETHPWIASAASRCQWAVDVGAGQGELLLCLLRDSSAESVYAFEPSGFERELLLHNVALNGVPENGRLEVVAKYVSGASSVDCVSLDSLPLNRHKRGFLKIDVDGAEMDVLRSGDRLLTESTVDVLLETHSRQLEEDCRNFLQERRYACAVIDNAWWRLILPEQRPLEHNRWLWASNDISVRALRS